MALPQARPVKAQIGDVLFRPADECPGFLSVTKGMIKVFLTGASGREIVLYRVGPGDVCLQTFSCLTDGVSYSAEGVVEAELEAELVSPDAYQLLLANDSAFRNRIMASVARRFADFEHLIETVALTRLDARLAEVLLKLACPRGDVRATHEEIAAEIGSAREVVSRQLGRFSKAGLVALSRGCVSILSKAGLQKIIDEAE